ncbi:hypothetical protein [Defluviicoccus vanus]|uniref:RNA polymerase sigma factor 70 region 4 type 2 domain-containing protein n=1 Tax=Defluviicoccus vanus TaxID=111831 RepID=A0A7H1N5A2_9PROT|nr:hypothetical protein [Defluviicoccus vanus]QNT70888.1 hypothetical protein HQ394_18175 [Defluviicoccus vanus]
MNYTGHSMSRQTGDRDTMIIPVIQHLRAFAHTLDDDRDHADGCVYAAVVKALHDGDWVRSETDVGLSLFKILYAQYFSDPGNSGPLNFGSTVSQETPSPSQLTLQKDVSLIVFRLALLQLVAEQRAALILIGPAGFSYANAAHICGCTVDRIRFLVDRAHTRLRDMLGGMPQAQDGGVDFDGCI